MMFLALVSAALMATTDKPGWTLAWHDEFDGSSLDITKWSIGLAWTGDDGTNRHHNSQYASTIMDDDIILSGGELKLRTTNRKIKNPFGKEYSFTEGYIHTAKKFSTKYGLFEARLRFPVDAGPGLWPAFWMLGEGWPPEMDIVEYWSSDGRFHQGLAYRDAKGNVQWDNNNVWEALPKGYHVLGLEWGPGYQIYTFDGVPRVRVKGDRVPAVPMYIILNSGIESGNKPTANTKFPNTFDVDWVRVYKRPSPVWLLDGGFEDQTMWSWEKKGYATVVRDQARSGSSALRLDGDKPSFWQSLYDLDAGCEYELIGYAKCVGDATAKLSIKFKDGAEASATVKSSGYSKLLVRVTSKDEPTTAVVTCTKADGTGVVFFDDLTFRKVVRK